MKISTLFRFLALKLLVLPLFSFNVAYATTLAPLPNLTIGLSLDSSNRLTVVQRDTTLMPVNVNSGFTYIWIDGQLVWTYKWSTMLPEETAFANGNNASAFYPQYLIGTHTVKACIDATNVILETNETDNCITKTLTSSEDERPAQSDILPDFTIDYIGLEGVTLVVDVRGGAHVSLPEDTEGDTYIWIDNMISPAYKYSWKTLAPVSFLSGFGKSTMYRVQPLSVGDHVIKACVDYNNNVEETREENNCKTQTISVEASCQSPTVLYKGQCSDPIPACSNPPANALHCVDKIENGRLIPNFNFNCVDGYEKVGAVCRLVYTDKYTGFAESLGNLQPFLQGSPVSFKFKALQYPSLRSVTPYDGWDLIMTQYQLLNDLNGNQEGISNLRVVYKDGYWNVNFDAPNKVGNYNLVLRSQCMDRSKLCGEYSRNLNTNVHYQVIESNEEKYKPDLQVTNVEFDSIRDDGSMSLVPDEMRVTVTNHAKVDAYSQTDYVTLWIHNLNDPEGRHEWKKFATRPGKLFLRAGETQAFSYDFDDVEYMRQEAYKHGGIFQEGYNGFVVSIDRTFTDEYMHLDEDGNVIESDESNNNKRTALHIDTCGKLGEPVIEPGYKKSYVKTCRPKAGDSGNASVNVSKTKSSSYEDDVRTAKETNPFSDTSLDTIEGKSAKYLHEQGIIGGFSDGTFRGSREVNRAELAKFLLLAKYAEVKDIENKGYFKDVLNGQWYTKYVVTAAGLGIINGYSDGNFRPAQGVNRAEFLKMLSKTFSIEAGLQDGPSFSDVKATDWFAPYTGFVDGFKLFPAEYEESANRGCVIPEACIRNLYPSRVMTRNEVAVAIYQYLSNRD